jgi:Lipid membrane protein of large eukaryotic DNA viruses
MGGSVSYNATNIVVNAVAKISSKIMQDTKISYDSSQVIYVRDTKGDVVIRGNKMIQKAYVNMQALFNAMSSASAQQDLALEIAQSAKSLTSGLNLGQFSDAENDLNLFINVSIEITTRISQTCSEEISQNQEIIIEHTIGSVTIENNLFEQAADMFSTCIQTSISNSSAIQSIILKLQQDSSATSQGLSEWALIGLIAVVLGVPTAGAVFVGKDILKFLFPLMIIAGIVMVIVYYTTKKQTIPVKAYSTFIEKTSGCLPDPVHPTVLHEYESVNAAGDYCMKSSDCAAFDWKGLDISSTGSFTFVKPPETKFYKSVDSNCRSLIQDDNVDMVRTPVVYFGPGNPPDTLPNLIKGDVWLNTTTSIWYQLTTTWIPNDTLIPTSFSKITVQSQAPVGGQQSGVDNEYVIVYAPSDPSSFGIYKYDGDKKWKAQPDARGPGLFSFSPEVTNASGVKETSGQIWLLYGGGSIAVIGLLGTIVSIVYGNKNNEASTTGTGNTSGKTSKR